MAIILWRLLSGLARDHADGKLSAGELQVPTTSADEPHIVWRLNVRTARQTGGH